MLLNPIALAKGRWGDGNRNCSLITLLSPSVDVLRGPPRDPNLGKVSVPVPLDVLNHLHLEEH